MNRNRTLVQVERRVRTVECPFCKAQPGQACHTREGRELKYGHKRRYELSRPSF